MALHAEKVDNMGNYETLINPLRKCRRDGKLYTRRLSIETKISELVSLSRSELVTRCQIQERTDPGYVPSECLLYFIRISRTDESDIYFEKLYKMLSQRVLRSLPHADSFNGKTISLSQSSIRDKVFERFINLIVRDRNEYLDKLDYYEINFNDALKKLRLDAQEQVWRDEKRSTTLYDEETGELPAAVERAAGSLDPLNSSALADHDYRSSLFAAIDTLPPDQRRIVAMIQQGIPIDSKDPSVLTVAKALNKSEKTIRTYRDKAYANLRAALTNGGDTL
jgi:DNA-directed RNA polymerase specialized sigma24 family protein